MNIRMVSYQIDTGISYSQLKLDEVQMELADFLGGQIKQTLQETGVLPMLKNVDENEKYVAKGYANVFHGIGTNIGRTESGEAFPMLYPHGVGNSSPDASHASATVASGMPLPTFFSDIFCTSGQPSMTSLMHHSPDVSLRKEFFLYIYIF
uniref:Uncharacterized protein n=1 Tax=Cucumis melo TaxID=3656 RepID=A0A9I9EEG9_CUCME